MRSRAAAKVRLNRRNTPLAIRGDRAYANRFGEALKAAARAVEANPSFSVTPILAYGIFKEGHNVLKRKTIFHGDLVTAGLIDRGYSSLRMSGMIPHRNIGDDHECE